MNTSKRIFALLIALTLVLTTGCGQNNETSDIDTTESVHIEDTEYVDETETTFDLSKYESSVTYWATENIDWSTGGYVLAIKVDEKSNTAAFELNLVQAAPQSRIATAVMEVSLNDITGNEVSLSFDNDGWGHSGDVQFTFTDSAISFAVSNVEYFATDGPEVWGFYDVHDTLVSNPGAFDDLTYTQDEYDAQYGGGETDYATQETVYNTSKASGILASLGMTEQEFRDSCQPLAIDSYDEELLTTTDLREYPANYVGQHFYFSSQFHDSDTQRCYDSICIGVDSKGISTDGYPTYRQYPEYDCQEYVHIFDLRDDVYSPTISEGDAIYPYMIFNGVQTINGTDYVCFCLISVDK